MKDFTKVATFPIQVDHYEGGKIVKVTTENIVRLEGEIILDGKVEPCFMELPEKDWKGNKLINGGNHES